MSFIAGSVLKQIQHFMYKYFRYVALTEKDF